MQDLKNKWEALSQTEKQILGKPNFTCGNIAARLRQKDLIINTRSEDEQAAVIFTMLEFYREYKDDWIYEINKFLID